MRCHVCAQVRSRSQPFACGHLRSHNYIIRGEHRAPGERHTMRGKPVLPRPRPPTTAATTTAQQRMRIAFMFNKVQETIQFRNASALAQSAPPPPQYQTHTCFIHGSCAHEDDAIACARARVRVAPRISLMCVCPAHGHGRTRAHFRMPVQRPVGPVCCPSGRGGRASAREALAVLARNYDHDQ